MSSILIPVAAPGQLPAEEAADVRAAVERVLASGVFVGGEEVRAFEAAFAPTVDPGAECVGVASGLDALILALVGLDLPEGSHVLVPANDGGYGALAAQSAGLMPAQVDVTEEGLVSLATREDRADARTSAVVVTHLHGLDTDTAEISRWCRRRSIRLVEDCSQAAGARGIGARADASAFSFYPTKNLAALGDAGAVVTRDPQVASRIRSLREYGWGERFVVARFRGRNSRLDALQAAVLTARLAHLPEANTRRREIASQFRAAAPTLRFLARDDDSFVAHHAVVVHPERAALADRLAAAAVGSRVHYPALASEMPGLRLHGSPRARVAERQRDQVLSLPCFPGMTQQQVAIVCEVLEEWEQDRG